MSELTRPGAEAPGFAVRFRWWHELALVALLVGVLVYAGIVSPRFLRGPTQLNLASKVWELALLALPMTLIIITSGIDLSVGATMALSAVVLGMSFHAGAPVSVAALLAVATGLACGLLNGVFVAVVRVHPLIVTLATLSAYRGLAEGISSGAAISEFPVWFVDRLSMREYGLFGLPVPGLLFALAAVFSAIVLAKTPFGRTVYAMGFNETACRFSGLPTKRVKMMLYAMSGLAAGVAAVLFVARRNTAKADISDGMELDVITAVVLGGTSIFGGRGSILGTLLGIVLIHEVREFITWYWRDNVLIMVVTGVLLILSVLLNAALSPRGRE